MVRGFCRSESPAGKQQHAAHGTAQQGLPRQEGKAAGADFVGMPRQHAEKVDDEKDRLPGKRK